MHDPEGAAGRDTAWAVLDPHVILLEDDSELRALVTRGLREEGFEVTAAPTAAELLRRLEEVDPDALVVDIGLPDADGRDVVQALRARGVGAPVIFLTARDALPDLLAGFAAGGDDYLTKPFAFAELVARLAGADQAGRERPRGRGARAAPRSRHACGVLRGGHRRSDADRVPDPRAARGDAGRRGSPPRARAVRRGPTERSSTTTPSTCTSRRLRRKLATLPRAHRRSRPCTASATRCDEAPRSACARGC